MSSVVQPLPAVDCGSHCLATVLALHGQPLSPQHIQRQFSADGRLDSVDMVRAARELGFKARRLRVARNTVHRLPAPCIIESRDPQTGRSHFVLARAAEDACLVQLPGQAPSRLTADELDALAGQHAIVLRPRAGSDAAQQRFGIDWFVPALWRYRGLLAEVLTASCFLQVFALLTPLFFQVVIDKVLAHGALTTLDVLVLGLLGVVLFEALLGGLRNFVFAHTASRVDVELGARLFKHLLALPIAYFAARPTGQTIARVRELENVRSFLTSAATTVIIDSLFLGLFLLVMFAYSPLLCAIVAATLPLYAALTLAITPVLRRRIEARFRCGAESQSFLVESVGSAETIKSMAIEPQQRARWESLLAGYTRASLRANTASIAGSQGVQFIGRLCTVVLLWTGARMVIDGSLSIGQLIAFNMLAGQVSGPILRLAQLWQDIQQFRLSVERLGDVLNTPTEDVSGSGRYATGRVQGDIRFSNVEFAYGAGSRNVLNGLDLHIEPGSFVGIVGRSGSGKSTLTRLIQRLYAPQRGRVLVDGADLGSVDSRWLRTQIGVVMQDSVLFSASVRDNIAVAAPQASLERVMVAAKLAGAHEFVTELPDGYDTRLEERGANLSGGQRQRLAIARALLTDPRILIFDEATSALDYESERVIQANMADICKGRTVIVVAHRLSTVRRADRIVVLDRGQVIEAGAHDQLMHSDGAYAGLWRQQAA